MGSSTRCWPRPSWSRETTERCSSASPRPSLLGRGVWTSRREAPFTPFRAGAARHARRGHRQLRPGPQVQGKQRAPARSLRSEQRASSERARVSEQGCQTIRRRRGVGTSPLTPPRRHLLGQDTSSSHFPLWDRPEALPPWPARRRSGPPHTGELPLRRVRRGIRRSGVGTTPLTPSRGCRNDSFDTSSETPPRSAGVNRAGLDWLMLH